MDNSSKKYIYICPNCEEEYHFYERIHELKCTICGDMVVKDEK